MSWVLLYCRKCRVKIASPVSKCPLCQNDLDGDFHGWDNCFPIIINKSKIYNSIIKIIAFILIAASVISAVINVVFPAGGFWSAFVIAGAITAGLTLYVALKKRNNILKNILWQTFLLSVIALAWDFCTGYRGWAIDYVLPISCGCAMIAMAVLAVVMKLHVNQCIIYFIIDSIFGVFPLILILCGVVNTVLPSFICIAISFVSLAVLLVFCGRTLKEEIVRRTHL